MIERAKTESASGARDPSTLEQDEGFRRGRLALFFKLVALLSGGFFVASQIALLLTAPQDWLAVLAAPSTIAHVAATLMSGAAWLALRRFVHSSRALDATDAAGTFAMCATFSFMVAGSHEGQGPGFVVLLATSWTLVIRAALVPVRAWKTALVGVVAMAPVVVAGYQLGPGQTSRFVNALNAGFWAVVAVVATTTISRIIYGLQKRVAEAMRVGQYTLEEKIGEGAMGVVFRARHALLRRPTAIKLLHDDRASERDRARFEREVQMTAQLSHPNTIAVYDFGYTPEGSFYYAMEYLEGITVEELVELDGPQPPARVAHLLAQICGALGEAHGAGLVHRDIKPANVFLTRRGGVPDVVKVLDFGLVKVTESEGAPQTVGDKALAGTPLYMAPESITDPESVDGRADLYSLGATGYYLLAGRPPFTGDSLIEVCSKHLHETPDPPSVPRGAALPRDLEALVLRCLAKEPAARAESAAALADELAGSAGERWSVPEARAWWITRGESVVARASARRRQLAGATLGNATTIAVDASGR